MPDAPIPVELSGTCHRRFAAVAETFAGHLRSGVHHGAAVAIHHRGEPVVDLWGGLQGLDGDERPWEQDTVVICFSTTKGVAATLLHLVMERNGVAYDTPVVDVWPDYARGGQGTHLFDKSSTTIRHVLCHEAGIPQIRDEVDDFSDIEDWDRMVDLMERLECLWEPGTANGYHAVNFGWLVGHLVELIDGRPFQQVLAEEVVGPLDLDGMFVGAPESEHHRFAALRSPGGDDDQIKRQLESLLPPDHLLPKVLSPPGDGRAWMNSAAARAACVPSFTGAFTARSLSRFYAALERGGSLDGVTLLKPDTLEQATTVQNKRPDLALIVPIHWRLGYMGGGSEWSPAGPHREAFGHAGLGGSVAIADPKAELSFALTLDTMTPNLLTDDRARSLIVAAIACAADA